MNKNKFKPFAITAAAAYGLLIALGTAAGWAVDQGETTKNFTGARDDLAQRLEDRAGKLKTGQCAYIDPSKPLTVGYRDLRSSSRIAWAFKSTATLTAFRPKDYTLGNVPSLVTSSCDLIAPEKRIAAGDFDNAAKAIADTLMRSSNIPEIKKAAGQNAGFIILSK